mmetsp:Transcript_34141/g.61319  ORF Transcript_34141/g.61319 Transcript_34141/m.61319 type:complete len:168 (+) Transcript_34141:36-539(+)|eukprot:CAMPEP_0201883312 /NCGR_PEP_ID=MMETSP0902-20130614/15386_1 /ASSEMBLY_ACC=CAM_ASM_000551 /TAXON_ID=420261 /ORGANISM="Thalassiosira antarctica, Strain CCMP982" /LENGTH=167 /DNA_ID=CAMNT_0048412069 /DNA_START=56 /DNA_END=559 /DNA_ORIENTATION=+
MGALSIEYGMINADNVEQLKKINQACFPVSYNDSFYEDMAKKQDENLCKFAYWNGFAVGAICTRVEPIPDCPGRSRIYIMTLGVLAAYRNHGIGRKLVTSVLDYFESQKDGTLFNTVDEIMLHVQTSNEDAMTFYGEKFGFEKGELVENYYKRIDPPHCYILRKKLR